MNLRILENGSVQIVGSHEGLYAANLPQFILVDYGYKNQWGMLFVCGRGGGFSTMALIDIYRLGSSRAYATMLEVT